MTDNMLLAELIDKYLEGKLNQEEKSAFEKRLHSEIALAEQVALQKKIIAGIKSTSRANIFQMLQEEDAKMPAYQPEIESETETKAEAKTITLNSASNRNRQMYYWAAAVILLLLMPLFFFLDKTNSSEKLFYSYFSPHQNQWVSDDSSSLPAQAMQYYERQNYALALPILEKLLGTESAKATAEAEVQFYKGNSHLALDHTKDAIACFESVIALAPNKYTEEAQWYLALSYVKIDEEKKAESLLKEIAADDDHPYKKDAQELLKKL